MRSPTLFTVFSCLITSASCYCKYSFLHGATSTYTFALSAGKPEFFTLDCSTFTQVINTDPARPYPGDWLFNATGYAHWDAQASWDPISTECSTDEVESKRLKRDSRAVIKAAGDANSDRFANVNVSVPFNTPCARLEGGGVYTDPELSYKQTCDSGLPSHVRVTKRRYVIDETMGAVASFKGERLPIYILCRLV
ncbi:hypothetical protein QBC32DRAFT_393164 [Pseudoneurospora amorphoporcata]|uniref:DUF8021 domain-containing protein n=1 Tax=Pseudoneurospora amorphoporcata TaxID=241081 RepID=A0AAN6SEY4_9PEZI|nr:hypothetical protein QBC32DRAFT_393164 [Pseudoneurospora amorphoporcata]